MPGIGRAATLSGPEGEVFSIFSPSGEEMSDVNGGKNGQICWNEMMVDDIKQSVDFYGKVLPWHVAPGPMGIMKDYYVSKQNPSDESMIAGLMPKPAESKDIPTSWMIYFYTDNLEASGKKVVELGGKILMDRVEIPGDMGYFTLFTDPTGAYAYLTDMK